MRKFLVLPLIAAVALAGCGKKEENAAGGADGVVVGPGAGSQAMITPDAGLYKINVEIAELSFPGMPAGAMDQMKKSMSSNMAVEQCVTEADRADAVKSMTKGAGNGNCTYSKYDMSGGKIDAVMSCKGEQGAESNFTMKGTIASNGVDMTMEGDTKSPAMPGGAMHMKMHMTSERVGDCKAGPAKT